MKDVALLELKLILTHYDGVSGASMSTQSLSMFVRFVNACSRLLVREVAILSCMGFRDLIHH